VIVPVPAVRGDPGGRHWRAQWSGADGRSARRGVARIGGQPTDAVSGFGSLWASDFERRLDRVDPVSGRVVQRVPIAGTATSVALDDSGVGVAAEAHGAPPSTGAVPLGRVVRVDPRTGRVAKRIAPNTFRLPSLTATSSAVCVLSTHESPWLWRIEPATGRTAATLKPHGAALKLVPSGQPRTRHPAAGLLAWRRRAPGSR
jgi:hypothetical protein